MPHALADFYRSKRVLVTGHTGFRGGWLVSLLKYLGAEVCGYSLPPATRPNFFDATLLDQGMTSIFEDIRDRNALAGTFAEFQPEIVIHCATQFEQNLAQASVQTFATNIMGTVHVLEEARQTGSVRGLVIATRVYDDREFTWGSGEIDSAGIGNPDVCSSACAELVASSYFGSFFENSRTALACARTANLIGGGDFAPGRVIAEAVRAIASEQPVIVPQFPTVAWQHALEAAHVYIRLGKKLYEEGQTYSGTWNFGFDQYLITPHELIRRFLDLWGLDVPIELDANATRPALQTQILTTEKTRTRLGWISALTLEEAIAWTAEWYRDFYSDPSVACRTTQEQIARYLAKVS